MVGTFISKYLLITTATITVTSSVAVTFFVAKHLKIGKNYEMAMGYIEDQYKAAIENKSEIEQDEGRVMSGIETSLENITDFVKKCITDKNTCDKEIGYLYIRKLEEKLKIFEDSVKRRKEQNDFKIIPILETILGVRKYNVNNSDVSNKLNENTKKDNLVNLN